MTRAWLLHRSGMVGGSILRRHRPALIRREGPSIRQACERLLPVIGDPMFKGSVTEVADLMEEWWRDEAGNGFTAMAPVQPRGLVVPGPQRRGLFHTEYEPEPLRGHLRRPGAPARWTRALRRRGLRLPGYRGATLRENMGLHRPPDSWSSLPAPGYVGG